VEEVVKSKGVQGKVGGGRKEWGSGFVAWERRGKWSFGKALGVEGSWSLRGGKASLAKAREELERLSWRQEARRVLCGESAVAAQAGCASFRVRRGAVQGEGAREQLEGDWCSVTSPGGQPHSGEAN
jgi:hypothetical protein